MHKRLCFGLLALFLSPMGLRPLHSETIPYPEKNPVFTVDLPQGWEAKHNNGAIRLVAEANAVVLLQQLTNVKDDATAKGAVVELANMQGTTFSMENMRISTHVREAEVGEFKALMTDGRGTDKGGNDTLWQVFVISSKEGSYFLLTSMWTDADGPKTESDRRVILGSAKPLLGH